MTRSPDPVFTVSFLSPSAVPAASSASRSRSNLFPVSDCWDPLAVPVQTMNTMSADRAAHSGRWHTWFRRRFGPWRWICLKRPSDISLPGHSSSARLARRDRPRLCGSLRPRSLRRRARAIWKSWPRSREVRVSPHSYPPARSSESLPESPVSLRTLRLRPRSSGEVREQRLPFRHGSPELSLREPLPAIRPHQPLEPHYWRPLSSMAFRSKPRRRSNVAASGFRLSIAPR